MAYQTKDVLDAMEADCGAHMTTLRADGGMVANNFLMQFQADILGASVERAQVGETTALGTACLAGLAVGFWKDLEELRRNLKPGHRFVPLMAEDRRHRLYEGWTRAVKCVRSLGPLEG